MSEKKEGFGTLYLCATPIGNLEDITYRAVRLLGEVELIAAEDTRHTRKLLTHYGIHTRLVSYHEHNKKEKGEILITHLLSGKDLILVSDAGLPGIADPGSLLVLEAIQAGITVSPIPGANAALSALICSGQNTTQFHFCGFLPKTKEKRLELLQEIKKEKATLVFYEAPHHLLSVLELFLSELGNRQITLGRELTKRFEEFERGSISEILSLYSRKTPRGEYVIIVEGANRDFSPTDIKKTPKEMVEDFMAEGMNKKEAMRETAKRMDLSRRDVYRELLRNN